MHVPLTGVWLRVKIFLAAAPHPFLLLHPLRKEEVWHCLFQERQSEATLAEQSPSLIPSKEHIAFAAAAAESPKAIPQTTQCRARLFLDCLTPKSPCRKDTVPQADAFSPSSSSHSASRKRSSLPAFSSCIRFQQQYAILFEFFSRPVTHISPGIAIIATPKSVQCQMTEWKRKKEPPHILVLGGQSRHLPAGCLSMLPV